jgi:hypothetical protein
LRNNFMAQRVRVARPRFPLRNNREINRTFAI